MHDPAALSNITWGSRGEGARVLMGAALPCAPHVNFQASLHCTQRTPAHQNPTSAASNMHFEQ